MEYQENIRIIDFLDNSIRVLQDLSLGIGGSVWDCALVYLKYLEKNFESLKKKYAISEANILELGTGTGICGIACLTFQPKKLVMTDKKEIVSLAAKNISLNEEYIKRVAPKTEVLSQPLLWGKENEKEILELEKTHGPFDVILGSDLTYDKEISALLYQTLLLVSRVGTVLILGYCVHKPTDIKFMELFKEDWECYLVPDSEYDPEYRSDDIGVVIFKRLR